MRDEQRKVLDVIVVGLPGGHCVCWRSGFETHGKKHDLTIQIALGKFQGIERRVDDTNIGALGLGIEQALRGTGHAQHVAERAKNDVGTLRDGYSLVNQVDRCHAHGAARTVHQGEITGQQVFQAALNDGMSLAATDFHDRPGTG